MRGIEKEERMISLDVFQRSHFAQVGEWLSAERLSGSLRFADIELNVNGRRDHLHSAVALSHSKFFRETLKSLRPPYTVNLPDNFRAVAVFKVIDWLYHGRADIRRESLGEFLEITTYLGIDDLHKRLERHFLELTKHENLRVFCLNMATDPRFGISANHQLAADIARYHDLLSTGEIRLLTPESSAALLADQNVTFNEKLDLLNLVLFWLRFDEKRPHLRRVLSHLYVPNIGAEECQNLIRHLVDRMSTRIVPNLNVYGKNRNTVVVSTNPQRFFTNSAAVVSCAEEGYNASPTVEQDDSEVGPQKVLEESMIREISRLPNFGGRSSRSGRRARKASSSFDYGSSTDEEMGLRLGVNKHGQFVGRPGQVLYQMKSESQRLVNPRGFGKKEVEEYQELPPSAEIFKETSYQPVKKRGTISKSSGVADAVDFRRPDSPASIPSDAYIVRPISSKPSRSSSKLSTRKPKSLGRRRSKSGSLNAHVFEKEMKTAKERSSRARSPNQKRSGRRLGSGKGINDTFDLRTAVMSTPKDSPQSSSQANSDTSSCSSNCSGSTDGGNDSSISTASSIHSAYLDPELYGTGSEYAFEQQKNKKN